MEDPSVKSVVKQKGVGEALHRGQWRSKIIIYCEEGRRGRRGLIEAAQKTNV